MKEEGWKENELPVFFGRLSVFFMIKICSYLTFNGNCREAMLFYKQCLGGKLLFQTLGDSPMGESLPPEMKKLILQASLIKDELVVLGTDMTADCGLIRGNSVSMMLQCSSKEEMIGCYNSLSAGGKASFPPAFNFQGAFFAELTDKYGNNWMLYFDKESR